MIKISSGVNLLPSLTKKEIKEDQLKSSIMLGTSSITFLVALVAAGLLFYNLFLEYKIKGSGIPLLNIKGLNYQIDEVNSEIDSKHDILETYVTLAAKTSFIDEILIERPDYKRTLDRIQVLLPEDLEIVEYSINESDEITLMGYAKDYYTLALFISRAQKVDLTEGYMADFYLESATLKDNFVEFTLNSVAIFSEEKTTTLIN